MFTMPTGQNGAVTGQYLVGSAGATTVPTWSGTIRFYYWVLRTGFVRIMFDTQSAGGACTNGAGDQYTMLALPYPAITPGYQRYPAGFVYSATVLGTGEITIVSTVPTALAYVGANSNGIHLRDWGVSTAAVQEADLSFQAFAP